MMSDAAEKNPWDDAAWRVSSATGMSLHSPRRLGRVRDNRVIWLAQSPLGAVTVKLLVNPFAIDESAEAIAKALEMPEAEQRRRMQRMRSTVAENNIYRWAAKIVSTLTKFDFPQPEIEERESWTPTGTLSMSGRSW